LNIPRRYRRAYAPGWDEKSEEIFAQYRQTPTAETGKYLLTSLNEAKKQQEKQQKSMEPTT